MARRSGFGTVVKIIDSSLKAAAKDAQRAQKAMIREQQRLHRENVRDEIRREKEQIRFEKAQQKEDAINYAKDQTSEATELQENLKNLLSKYHGYNAKMDWNKFKNFKKFDEKKPIPKYPKQSKEIAPCPKVSDFLNANAILFKLFPKLKEKRLKQAEEIFKIKFQEWENQKQQIEEYNNKLKIDDEVLYKKWESRKEQFDYEKKIVICKLTI